MRAGMLPAWVSNILSIPWAEEILMVLCTAVVYICTHCILKSAELLPQKRPEKPRKLEEAWEEVRGATAKLGRPHASGKRPAVEGCEGWKDRLGGRGSAAAPRPLPKTSMEVEGVTNCRFKGNIVSYKSDEGYGFITCPELYKLFRRDVFLHRLQVGTFGVGDTVSFGVFLNKNGHPQAKELELAVPFKDMVAHGEAAGAGRLLTLLAKPWAAPAPEVETPALALVAEEPVRLEEPQAVAKQKLNPYAKPYVAGCEPRQRLNPFAKEFMAAAPLPPAAEPEAAQAFEALSGIWVGDRNSTYEVCFHPFADEGQPVGTAVRHRPSGAQKSFPLHWDMSSGCLQLRGSFELDAAELKVKPDMAVWRRGESQFKWFKVGHGSNSVDQGPCEAYFEEEDWNEAYYEQKWEESWAHHSETWAPKGKRKCPDWIEGREKDLGSGQKATQWVPKEAASSAPLSREMATRRWVPKADMS